MVQQFGLPHVEGLINCNTFTTFLSSKIKVVVGQEDRGDFFRPPRAQSHYLGNVTTNKLTFWVWCHSTSTKPTQNCERHCYEAQVVWNPKVIVDCGNHIIGKWEGGCSMLVDGWNRPCRQSCRGVIFMICWEDWCQLRIYQIPNTVYSVTCRKEFQSCMGERSHFIVYTQPMSMSAPPPKS